MESDEEEDSNSLLSLSLLQTDNGSAMTLSTNQTNTWSSSADGAVSDMVNQFSPVSPADSYHGQVLAASNDDGFNRFYNFRSSENHQHVNKSSSFIRTDSSAISVDSSFQSLTRINTGDFSHSGSGAGHGSGFFDQTLDARGSEEYINKDPESSFRSNQYEHIPQTRLDSTTKANQTNLNHNEGYSNIMNISVVSESDGKMDIFESRTRQNNFIKDIDNFYEQSLNKSSMKSGPNNDILLDRKHVELSNFDVFDDFPSSNRDFTQSSSKLDASLVTRINQQGSFHHQQGGFDMCQTSSVPKHSALISFLNSGSQLINSSTSIESTSKRIPPIPCSGFNGFNINEYVRSGSSSQKKPSFIQNNEIPSDFQPVFHSDFTGQQKLSPEPHVNFDHSNLADDQTISRQQSKSLQEPKDYVNKWSGRPRAHRKMARLLGSDVKEQFNIQETSKSSNGSVSHSKNSYQPVLQNDFASNGRNFLTMDEELDIRASQQQERQFLRKGETLTRHQVSQRELGFMQSAAFSLDATSMSSSSTKDSMNNILANQQFLIQSQLDLDFHSSLSQRDIDLSPHFGLQTVSKEFEADQSNVSAGQDLITFEQSHLQHINQQDLSLTDNLGLGSHHSHELNLDAYFATPSEKEVTFGRKSASDVQRDNGDTADFNIEEFMNHKDIGQVYFDRSDLPQDMTLYQKTEKQVSSEIPMVTKDKLRAHHSVMDKQSDISELQKELTKTSAKESMKRVRTPRDINRALEILQGLQEHEQEEERRKAVQLRQQQYRSSAIGASPKKTFHNKHLVEQMGISIQPFLGQSSHFIEDQSVNNLLDQSQLIINDAHQDGNVLLTQYQQKSFIPVHQPNIVNAQNKKDSQNSHQNVSDLTYHAVKTFPNSMKDMGSSQSTSVFINQHSNLASMLTANSTVISELPNQEPRSVHFQGQQTELDSLAGKIQSQPGNLGAEPTAKRRNESVLNENRDKKIRVADANTQISEDFYASASSRQQEDLLMSSRKSLYAMMTREEFCDAVLSTPKQTVKIHQAVLCSMSQYLSTLLLNMKPNPSTVAASSEPISPSTFYFSNSVSNQGVLLLVNCETIKPSSISAFLVFIYLGKTEFSESNILDLYILACSLKVTSLEDLCKKFMWSTQMPDDHIKVPQLLVFSHKSETRDQSSMAELGAPKVFEDKSINTASNVKYMEVSTQTDRSTTESGGGGQEEWVMLKKTKQKTVSPSKGPLLNKSNQSCENIVNCKVGKKGWLSPKKHKLESPSEVGHTSKDNFLKIGNIEVSKVNDAVQRLEERNASNQQTFFQLVDTEQSVDTNTDAPEKPFGINFPLECQNKLPAGSPLSQSGPSLHKRTTVEIAAAAAAAKLSAHSYGTRLARGNGRPPSYATLVSVQEKKKAMSQKEKAIPAVSKKKDFIKSNPPIEYSPGHNNVQLPTTESLQAILENKCEDKITTNKSASNTSNLSVKRPIKKSIVHRTEFLRNAFTKDTFLDAESVNVKSDISSALMNEYMDTGDGNDCTFIDSIVNTIEAENMDFQKVISDLDNELNRSPPPAPTPVSSSVSSTSLASPLKSPQLSLATSESSSPVKAKSTPQGFRKRLIHMMNSENSTFLQVALPVSQAQAAMTLSSSQIDAQASVFQPSPEVTLNNCQPEPKQTSSTGEMTLPSKLNLDLTKSLNKSSSTCSEATLYNLKENYSYANSYLQNIEEEDLESPIQNKHSVSLLESSLNKHTLMTAMEVCDIAAIKTQDKAVSSPLSNFSLMTDRDLGLKDSQIQSFDHKIFKRKKKIKVRKLPVAEVELLTSKSKKCDSENSLTKARQRKVTGSDSEGGGGGRLKKLSADRPQTQANVRPPPKKRAKMELELMKAANEVKTKNVDTKMRELEKCCVSENASDAYTPTCAVQENELTTIVEVTSDRNRTTVDKKPPENKVGQNLNKSSLSRTDQSTIEKDSVFLEETKLTSLLESKIKKTNCKKPITCTLCQSKFRRARRAVKHVLNHGVSSSEVMDNISFGQGEEQEACGVCGYVTKDQSYHYMHYHKYFKHGIPLPMGWKADRCEICGKECFNKFQLKEHMHTHKEGQGYICWICGQSFRSRNCFNSHVFHKHNQIRKYKCKVCEKCFKTWTQLKVHVRSHTGERPFSCTECEHRSSTQGNMRLHLTTHGLGKDKIQELMEKIAKNVTEMTPESLEQIMDNLVKETSANKKVDLKQPACKKTKSHAKSRQSTQENDKSDEKKSRKLVPDLKPKPLLLKFEGTELKRIFTQPLSQVEPPKLLRSLLNKTVANGNDITEEEKSSIQVNQNEKSEPGLVLDMGSLKGMLQQMPASLPPATTVFIPMPDQDQVLQQQQFIQHPGTTNQSLLGYTAVPTFFLSGQTGSLESGGSILTISDLTSSGLGVMSQTIQLVQPKGMSSVQLGGQDLVADNFI
ncbi:CAunnamed protein product, partial [Biomphalaria glabrata]